MATVHARINLIGEHVDYNGGVVCPLLIAPQVEVTIKSAPRGQVDVESRYPGDLTGGAGEQVWSDRWNIDEDTITGGHRDYFQGIWVIARKWGLPIGDSGFSIKAESTIPIGSGVSSSAALLCGLTQAASEYLGWNLSALDQVRFAHAVESLHVGARVGILDPFACTLGALDEVLILETQSLEYQRIAVPEEWSFGVLFTGIRHSLRDSGGTRNYATRRQECERAAAELGVPYLWRADPGALSQLSGTLRLRAEHVLGEKKRVADFCHALRKSDAELAGHLINACHDSLSGLYEVSEPEIDAAVKAVREDVPRCLGIRIMGGGFGGSLLWLCKKNEIKSVYGDIAAVAKRHLPLSRQLLPQESSA